jgi:hypothetical protein
MKKERKKKEISKKENVIEDEIFQVEKDGEEKIVRKEILEEDKLASPEQLKKEKKVFMSIMIAMAGFILLFAIVYSAIYFSSHFIVKGVEFERMKIGEILVYKTNLPVDYQGGIADYNFYLRTDPRELEKIPFNGDIILQENMVLNLMNDFNCDGDGMIAIGNVQNLYSLIGTKIISDKNATCDSQGRYIFMTIEEGNETKITEYGSIGGCYEVEVSNCEILKATEKFMLETFIKVNKELKE